MKQFIALAAVALSVAACAKPLPPTFTAGDVTSSQTTFSTLTALPATSLVAMPNAGSASYTGLISGDFVGASDISGGLLGDLALNVNFASGQISGAASNINLIDGSGTPDQNTSGSLAVSGNVVGNTMAATATGRLGAVYLGIKGVADFDLALGGAFRTDVSAADTITGAVTGVGSGDIYVVITNGQFGVQQ